VSPTKQRRKPRKRKNSQRGKGALPVFHLFPRNLLQHFGINDAEYAAISAFQKLKDRDKLGEARKIIRDSIINAVVLPDASCALAIAESESLLKGYATLDEPHRAEIANLIKQITAYLRDTSRKRPFNALMLAAPGAGKSHFIKQLASTMRADRVQAVTFNMATMQSPDDMAQPVDELRNLKVNDRFPLLFLDEFDSDPSRYAALLPLLWEGALHVGHRDLRLGKAVIVLAGSNPDLPKAMDLSAEMRFDADTTTESIPTGKLVDLLSRINGGVINIPDFDLRTEDRDRRVDKVCVTVALLRDRFGDQLAAIPRSLLRFVAHTKFRYGVRSIAHLIDVIDNDAFRGEKLNGVALGLPTSSEKALGNSSLKLHLLDKDQGFGIVNRWQEFAKDRAVVNVSQRQLRQFLRFSR
jgi:Viral (Superfamily 1) RNA helicase